MSPWKKCKVKASQMVCKDFRISIYFYFHLRFHLRKQDLCEYMTHIGSYNGKSWSFFNTVVDSSIVQQRYFLSPRQLCSIQIITYKKKNKKKRKQNKKQKRVSLLLWEAKGICVIIYTMHITLVSKHYISGIASIKGIKSAASA